MQWGSSTSERATKFSSSYGIALLLGGATATALVAVFVALGWANPRTTLQKEETRSVPEKNDTKEKNDVIDIEDIVGKSLIPRTLKVMKTESVIPYTAEEKREKVQSLEAMKAIPNFAAHVRKNGVKLLRKETKVLQLNIGFYCNQACSHCHVDSSPLRKQMMSKEVAEKCVEIIKRSPSIETVDLTGGAPELNRQFRFIVRECSKLGKEIIDRCNLTVLLEPHQGDLPRFLAEHKVRVIASLPCYLEDNVDSQRGDQIFVRSIKGLQMLNEVGFGKKGSGLHLDLVYNPTGIHLPPTKEKLIGDYKRVLKDKYGIMFNDLHCITNMPINRFYDHLQKQGRLEEYMEILVNAFNPQSCGEVMCTSYLSVDPNGNVFDCDFNQQLDLHFNHNGKSPVSVFDFDETNELFDVPIVTKKHCFGCTAGQGSS